MEIVMSLHPLQWFLENTSWIQLPGYLGAVFVVASFLAKTMIPLRVLTILSNLCFIAYSDIMAEYPMLFLYVVLLPLNALRLYQMVVLVRRMRAASQGEQTLGALKPFMQRGQFKAGQVVFRKGDPADKLFYLVSGKFCVPEIGMVLQAGDFVGELGMLAPCKSRTQTLECTVGGDVLTISYEHVAELYYQNPDFGYHFLRLTAGRLFQNIDALQKQAEMLRAELAELRSTAPGGVR
jgi:CRP/FNR family transcriptional regulator, cyclic AMP receptor protein